MNRELIQFFRSCTPEILQSYHHRYLDGVADADDPDQIVAAMADLMTDRKQVRAILKQLKGPHHLAIIALVQAGGIAGGSWLLQELTATHGKREDVWAEVMHELGRKLLVFGNSRQAPPLFYVMPQPMMTAVGGLFSRRMRLPASEDEAVRLSKDTNFNFPVGFSVTSLLTWLGQQRIRVTQKGEIFKKNLEEVVGFFGHLWGRSDAGKVMDWHLQMMRLIGLVRVVDGHLVPDESRVRQWLDFEPRQRRDLFMGCFESTDPLAPWLLGLLDEVAVDAWVPVEPLNVMYRRRYMGSVFQKRFIQKAYYLPPSGFFNPLPPLESMAIAGLIERGLGESGSMVRISEAGREFLDGHPLGEAAGDVPVQFHLQPNFEVLAPAGLPLDHLHRLGQMCEFLSCDRMNRYLLTADTVRSAIDAGWRRSELLRFLREGAAYGVPQNVDSTVDEWIGERGEVEFHDALVATVHPDKEDALRAALDEAAPGYRRMAPGVYAVARETRAAVVAALEASDSGLDPAPWVRHYKPQSSDTDAFEQVRDALVDTDDIGLADVLADPADFPTRQLVVLQPPDARSGDAQDSMEMLALNGDGRPIASLGYDLGRKPGAAGSGDLLKLSPTKTLDLVRAALHRQHDIEILYRRSGEGPTLALTRVTPKKIHDNGGMASFEGYDHREGDSTSFVVKRIQGIRLVR